MLGLVCLVGSGSACGGSTSIPAAPSSSVKADFSLYTGNGVMVTMTDKSVGAISKNIAWGDDKTGTDLVHIYEKTGDYTITLTVTNQSGATDTKSSAAHVTLAEFNLGSLTSVSSGTGDGLLPSDSGATCTLAPVPVAGRLRYRAQMTPGGSQVQYYLLRYEDVQIGNIGCGSNRPSSSCPRGIGPQIISESQDVFWEVNPDRYCLAVRSISPAPVGRRISGPVDLIAPYIP